jgi:hypothetical protein
MKRIVEWVRTILARPQALVVDDQPSKPLTVEDLVIPDIYADACSDTAPQLKILDPTSTDSDESTGFNPYDTAVLRRK